MKKALLKQTYAVVFKLGKEFLSEIG